ncbi:Transposon TX1 uncharacterized 149 kDa protein [Vitis vinifera]|uniref:Transposon TX1 uncharacterized 149 kDa protein n=1 Tax=Vitis vinifera TaxID=29760 RepID=A0A438FUE8_VITVI|nr:Transposon TX1 uncharacterized 149 kDa protein [Vitis vinifera]
MSGSFPSLKAFKKYFLDGHQITGRLSWILIRSSGDQHLLGLRICGLQHHNFKESFSRWWREFEGNGWEGHKFMRKLQFVKAKLKDWNKNTFGMLKERKKTILDEIANIDAIEQEGALSSDLAAQRVIRKGELEELILREEIHWKQKAKIKWVKEGIVTQSCFMNSESITEEILLYFKKLYSSPPGKSWRVEGIDWSPISEESASRLDSPFAEAEIFNAIFQLDRDKAPGPDGFTIAVFQDCWNVIKEDLVRVFAEFHNSGIINQNTNASFIVLLPKKSQSKKISDFRPISLITCLYKIIAKVLSARLRGVLQETIPLHSRKKRSGEEGVVFKIDFEKAYDHVKWDFLDHVLEKKGFSSKWRSWMRGCLSSVSYAILSERGLQVGRNRCRVTHLQFADDTILFANPREEELQTLKSLLLVFGQISGLKVNLDKSNIFGINLDQNHLSRLALLLDCKASDWPILYLGLPLGGNPIACGFWDPVIERISRRLDAWQKAYLSFGGVGEGKRDHLVRWESSVQAEGYRGLGIGKIPLRNRALLGKWLWRFPRESTSLWHQEMGKEFAFGKICGGGTKTLKDQYPRLFRVVMDKNIPISSIFGSSRPFSWNFNFRRNLTDSEIEDLERLMPLSRLYELIHFHFRREIHGPYVLQFVWKSQVPFKVKAFIWLVAHKKVNTNDLLQLRRPHKAISPDICKLCMEQGESTDHLFLHCSVTLGLWHRLFQLAKMGLGSSEKHFRHDVHQLQRILASPREG